MAAEKERATFDIGIRVSSGQFDALREDFVRPAVGSTNYWAELDRSSYIGILLDVEWPLTTRLGLLTSLEIGNSSVEYRRWRYHGGVLEEEARHAPEAFAKSLVFKLRFYHD
jgi:hypothetical protein